MRRRSGPTAVRSEVAPRTCGDERVVLRRQRAPSSPSSTRSSPTRTPVVVDGPEHVARGRPRPGGATAPTAGRCGSAPPPRRCAPHVEGQCPLLHRDAVDARVEGRHRVRRQDDREAGTALDADQRVQVRERALAGVGPRLHQRHGPGVALKHRANGHRPAGASPRASWARPARGRPRRRRRRAGRPCSRRGFRAPAPPRRAAPRACASTAPRCRTRPRGGWLPTAPVRDSAQLSGR